MESSLEALTILVQRCKLSLWRLCSFIMHQWQYEMQARLSGVQGDTWGGWRKALMCGQAPESSVLKWSNEAWKSCPQSILSLGWWWGVEGTMTSKRGPSRARPMKTGWDKRLEGRVITKQARGECRKLLKGYDGGCGGVVGTGGREWIKPGGYLIIPTSPFLRRDLQ